MRTENMKFNTQSCITDSQYNIDPQQLRFMNKQNQFLLQLVSDYRCFITLLCMSQQVNFSNIGASMKQLYNSISENLINQQRLHPDFQSRQLLNEALALKNDFSPENLVLSQTIQKQFRLQQIITDQSVLESMEKFAISQQLITSETENKLLKTRLMASQRQSLVDGIEKDQYKNELLKLRYQQSSNLSNINKENLLQQIEMQVSHEANLAVDIRTQLDGWKQKYNDLQTTVQVIKDGNKQQILQYQQIIEETKQQHVQKDQAVRIQFESIQISLQKMLRVLSKDDKYYCSLELTFEDISLNLGKLMNLCEVTITKQNDLNKQITLKTNKIQELEIKFQDEQLSKQELQQKLTTFEQEMKQNMQEELKQRENDIGKLIEQRFEKRSLLIDNLIKENEQLKSQINDLQTYVTKSSFDENLRQQFLQLQSYSNSLHAGLLSIVKEAQIETSEQDNIDSIIEQINIYIRGAKRLHDKDSFYMDKLNILQFNQQQIVNKILLLEPLFNKFLSRIQEYPNAIHRSSQFQLNQSQICESSKIRTNGSEIIATSDVQLSISKENSVFDENQQIIDNKKFKSKKPVMIPTSSVLSKQSLLTKNQSKIQKQIKVQQNSKTSQPTYDEFSHRDTLSD